MTLDGLSTRACIHGVTVNVQPPGTNREINRLNVNAVVVKYRGEIFASSLSNDLTPCKGFIHGISYIRAVVDLLHIHAFNKLIVRQVE
jgi:hypothetical protein